MEEEYERQNKIQPVKFSIKESIKLGFGFGVGIFLWQLLIFAIFFLMLVAALNGLFPGNMGVGELVELKIKGILENKAFLFLLIFILVVPVVVSFWPSSKDEN